MSETDPTSRSNPAESPSKSTCRTLLSLHGVGKQTPMSRTSISNGNPGSADVVDTPLLHYSRSSSAIPLPATTAKGHISKSYATLHPPTHNIRQSAAEQGSDARPPDYFSEFGTIYGGSTTGHGYHWQVWSPPLRSLSNKHPGRREGRKGGRKDEQPERGTRGRKEARKKGMEQRTKDGSLSPRTRP
jgi:hypothetical protein